MERFMNTGGKRQLLPAVCTNYLAKVGQPVILGGLVLKLTPEPVLWIQLVHLHP